MSGYDFGSKDPFSQDFDAFDFFNGLDTDQSSTTSETDDTITLTMLASLSDLKEKKGVFYNEKALAHKNITHRKESDLPDEIVAIRFRGKRGERRIEAETKDEYADLLNNVDQFEFRNRNQDGSEAIRSISNRNIKIGSMSDEEYAQIHSAAMRSLSLLAEQYREHAEAAESDEPSTILSRHEYTILTGREEKQLPVGGLFPTNLPRSHPLSSAKQEQLRDEEAFEEQAIRKEHVKKRDDSHTQRLDEHKIKERKTEEILHSMIEKAQRGKSGENTHKT